MMNKPGLREIKKEATAHALAEAAFALATERGLDGFVVEDVVQRAGYSRRTFANHFACKEEAVAMSALISSASDDVKHLMDEMSEGTKPLDVLYHVMKMQFTSTLLMKLRELLLLSQRYPTLEPYILKAYRELKTEGQKTFHDLYKDYYSEEYSHLLIGVVYGAILPVLDGSLHVSFPGQSTTEEQDAVTFDQYMDTVFGYLRNGF